LSNADLNRYELKEAILQFRFGTEDELLALMEQNIPEIDNNSI